MAKKSKKKSNSTPIFIIALLVLLLVAVAVFFVVRGLNRGEDITVVAPSTQAPEGTEQVESTLSATAATDINRSDAAQELASQLGMDDAVLTALDESQMVKVDDLSVNPNLPEDWMNVLLLGSDERDIGENARTDAIIICSINKKTGAVKLSSIMRDTAVDYTDLGDLSGIYRINAANYFGGERLVMKLLNEKLGMNIEYYVHVNFYGFQQIVQKLGGIDVDVTEAEQEEINYRIVEQARWAYDRGMTDDQTNIPYQYLEEYGPNVHLDGRMALAYARIRHVDSDYARTERQRTVLTKLMEKVKGLGAAELLSLGTSAMSYLETNMTLDAIISTAMVVTTNGINLTNVQSFRIPVNNTYVQESRDGQSMLYDTDWGVNQSALYNFIYE